MNKIFLAIDIGASSGRHILSHFDGKKIVLEEIHRFQNQYVEREGTFCWDVDFLFDEIKKGIKKCGEIGKIPTSIGIDTWGVDFVLLDDNDNMIGNPVAYRDKRTDGMREEIHKTISREELYNRAGIQELQFNTIFQFNTIKNELERADDFLFIPEYFNFLLTGVKMKEYTNATTSGLVNAEGKDWDYEVIDRLGYPKNIFKEIHMPGSVVGKFSKEIEEELGFSSTVVLPCTHDTGSAVLAVPKTSDAIYISSGTWSLIGVEEKIPHTDIGSMKAGLTNEGGYDYRYRYLKNIMGLWMIQSIKKELNSKYTFDELCEMAEENKDFSSELNVNDDSFLSPVSMIDAVKEYCRKTNQRVPDSLGEVVQCVYVSLAKEYNRAVKEIETLTDEEYKYICIVGGGSKDHYLNRLTEEITGKKITAGPTEATAIGNILVQMICAGEIENIEEGKELIINSFDIKGI